MSEATLSHDAVTQVLFDQIQSGIEKINKANETLLAEEESGAGLREIDKALKDAYTSALGEDGKVSKDAENLNVVKAFAKAEELRKQFKAALDNARNAYRTEVLKEEAKTVSDVDTTELKEATKQDRKMILEAVTLLKTYAGANGKKDVVAWADTLEIPQVGRQGTSVVGQKKPRAYVSVNGTVHDSFGEAAKAASVLLSTEDNKVSLTSGDLVAAWAENGEKSEFTFRDLKVKVEMKEKASDKK